MPGVPRSACYWMTEHPEAERVGPIAGDVRAVRRGSHERCGAGKIKAALERRGVTASGRRIVSIMRRRGMAGAYARRTSEPHRTRADGAGLANILGREFDGYGPRAHLAGGLTYVRVGGEWAYVCLLAGLANRGITGHSAGRARDASLVLGAFAMLGFPLTGVEVFHTDRGGGFDDTRIAVEEGRPVRQRRGRIHQQAPEEGAHIPEPPHRPGTTTLRPQRLCVVVRRPKTPLHPRIPEPQRIHTTRTRPLKNCPTHRCQSMVMFGPPGTSKTHLAIALGREACRRGVAVRFFTAAGLVMRLLRAGAEGKLDRELQAIGKARLLVIDELGYVPIDEEGSRLLFQVVTNAYEAQSVIYTTNIEFSGWGRVFGDPNMAAAIIDRTVHHGRMIRFEGESYGRTHALMQ